MKFYDNIQLKITQSQTSRKSYGLTTEKLLKIVSCGYRNSACRCRPRVTIAVAAVVACASLLPSSSPARCHCRRRPHVTAAIVIACMSRPPSSPVRHRRHHHRPRVTAATAVARASPPPSSSLARHRRCANGYVRIVSDVTSSARCEAPARPATHASAFAKAVAVCPRVR